MTNSKLKSKAVSDEASDNQPLEPGDQVIDRDSTDATPSVGTVVGASDEIRADSTPISELPHKPTVYEFNPEYPPDDGVVNITFDGEQEYSYPRSRLRRATSSEVSRA